MRWQLQDAKQRFSELVRKALDEGPQFVTRHGEEVAVLVSAKTYRHLVSGGQDFKQFLLSAPDLASLEITRSDDAAPRVEG